MLRGLLAPVPGRDEPPDHGLEAVVGLLAHAAVLELVLPDEDGSDSGRRHICRRSVGGGLGGPGGRDPLRRNCGKGERHDVGVKGAAGAATHGADCRRDCRGREISLSTFNFKAKLYRVYLL